MSRVYRQDVTDWSKSASVANVLPTRYLLRCPMSCKTLCPTLSNCLVPGYGAKAGQLSTTLPTVQISSLVSLCIPSATKSSWDAICNRRQCEASCHFLFRDNWYWFLLSWVQALVSLCNKCLKPMTNTQK